MNYLTTAFSEINRIFLSKITDRDLIQLADEIKEEIMGDFLGSAIAQFHLCEKNLEDVDDLMGHFNETLDRLEKEILARFMVIEWTNGFIQSEDFLLQSLGNKDYTVFSPSNHLDKLLALRSLNEEKVNGLIHEYYYRVM